MFAFALVAMCVGCDPESSGSYLYQPAYCIDEVLRGPARPYSPQPGDLMLATDNNVFWKITHNLGGTGHPHHTGIVFQRCDGSMAVLESGPYDTLRIRTLDAIPHLGVYECRGRIWIRQRKAPITPEQSACLTAFAMEQDGKPFALVRLGGQLSPFRTRGPIRTEFVGKPNLHRNGYYCSELATTALVAAGLIDAADARPSATYPRDIFMDRSLNPFINKHMKLCDCWYPPARWTACPATPIENQTQP